MQTGNFSGFEVALHHPGIALITFNQPERLNGMTAGMKRDLVETIVQAQMDDGVRVIVFTGSGRAFSAGDDITGREFEGGEALVDDIPRGHHNPIGTYNGLRSLSQPLNLAVRNLDKLTIAAVNGAAVGAGKGVWAAGGGVGVEKEVVAHPLRANTATTASAGNDRLPNSNPAIGLTHFAVFHCWIDRNSSFQAALT